MFNKKSSLKILFVTTELKPFAGVGGLGPVMQALPKALNKIGHDARVMIPKYLGIEDKGYQLTLEHSSLEVPTDNASGAAFLICNVKKYEDKENEEIPITYFLENQEYYEKRANIYGYADDSVRWALLCRGTLEFLRFSDWIPDVIVCSDWQMGFLPNYLKTVYKNQLKFSRTATVFSIHNLSYQGNFDHRFTQELDFDDGHSAVPAFEDPRLLKLNGMRRGIIYSDYINTVSPSYAREIMTEEYGEGLQDLLKERRAVVSGILNGIDYELWDSEGSNLVENHYSLDNQENRVKNKAFLQDRFGLPINKEAFVIGIAARLSSQKGFSLLQESMASLLRELNMQLIVVGEGSREYMIFLQELQKEFPKQVSVHLKFDPILPHTIFSGADAVLVPSKFEPSGLTQMEAMHFGAVPIARKTGGLSDTVYDYSPENEKSNGFLFEKFDSFAMTIAVVRAYEDFQNKNIWKKLQINGMKKDFSWEHSAKKYEELFRKAIDAKIAVNKKTP